MPKPRQIFISHSSKDRDFIEREIVGLLQSHGIETWYSRDDIGTAAEWDQSILAGLESCDWFLVVLSPRSIKSKWVKAEIDWAMENREGNFVPVLIEECEWKRFYLLLRNFQYADLASELKNGQKRLLGTWGIQLKDDAQTNTREIETNFAVGDNSKSVVPSKLAVPELFSTKDSRLQRERIQTAVPPAEYTVWLTHEVSLPFRKIPDGEFWMGESSERHLVRITRPFFMGTFPVTHCQWRAVLDHSPQADLQTCPGRFGGDSNPVEQVNWKDANKWCGLFKASPILSEALRQAGLTGFEVGLPSEAQWEYACRAGTSTEYYTGDGETALSTAGWYGGNAKRSSQPVGLLSPNNFGLFDMHGNVSEWCRDAWNRDAYKNRVDGVCDPEIATTKDTFRVNRGGAYLCDPWHCTSARRNGEKPGRRSICNGFRVCLFNGPRIAGG